MGCSFLGGRRAVQEGEEAGQGSDHRHILAGGYSSLILQGNSRAWLKPISGFYLRLWGWAFHNPVPLSLAKDWSRDGESKFQDTSSSPPIWAKWSAMGSAPKI